MAVSKEFGHHSFIQTPPDSTGKILSTLVYKTLGYSNGTIDFKVGEKVIGFTSGAIGRIVNVSGTTETGEITVIVDDISPSINYTDGENLQVNAVTNAVLVSSVTVHSQSLSLAGANNPLNQQFVDDRGAAYIRFSEGEQQLDAFGLSRQVSPSQLSQYLFNYDVLPDQFTDSLTGAGAAVSHLPDEAGVALDVGTVSGESAIRISDKYHSYQAGFGQLIKITVASGDTGKTNVRRRWGYFDENDGLFFELDGTVLNVVIRSSASGSVVESRIAQSNWNGDVLDGSRGPLNLSKMNLDVSNLSIYWIDLAWLGAGRVRFGVYDDSEGSRIVCHTVETGNKNPFPFIRQANLPVRAEIENTGATGSPSRLKLTCGTVSTEGTLVDDRDRRTVKWTRGMGSRKSVSDTGDTHLLSFRSTSTINGVQNRFLSVPETFSFYVENNPVLITLYLNPGLAGDSWVTHSGTAADIDTSASSFTGGDPQISWMFDTGTSNIELPRNFGIRGQSMHLGAEGSPGSGDIYSIMGRCLVGSGISDITAYATWIDVG
jgi:hypothetical protein